MLNTENQELLQAIGLMIDEKLDARFAEQEARFDAKLEQLESRFDAKLDQLAARFDAKLEHLEARFDAKLVQLESRFDAKLEQLESRFDDKLEQLESRFDDKLKQLESRFDAKLDARFKQSESMLLDEIERIHMQVWDNSIKLKQLQKEISLLRSREKDFGIVYAYLNALDSRVTRLESATSPA